MQYQGLYFAGIFFKVVLSQKGQIICIAMDWLL